MSARQLWTDLERAGVTLTAAAGKLRVSAPAGVVTPAMREQLAEARDELLALLAASEASDVSPDPRAEFRRQRIVAIFESNPRITRAVVTDTQSEPGAVVVTIGLRGGAIGEIVIPAGRYDGLALLALLERYATDPQPAIH
jgi:tubulysin polyketide synthase-like protein